MTFTMHPRFRLSLTALLALFLFAAQTPLLAQTLAGAAGAEAGLPNAPDPATDTESNALTMFSHPEHSRYFIAGQANIIFQAHAPFHAEYSGTNSLLNRGEY